MAASNPNALEQLFVNQPGYLQNYLNNLSPQDQQQFFTAAALALLRTYVNVGGSGNQVSLGFLSSATIGSGSLFTQNITPDGLAMVNEALSDSIALSNYTLNVTTTGGNNVFVGGVLGNFTALGGGNNKFVIEDPTLLGVSSPTLLPAAVYQDGGTFTGSGGSDQFYFVGGANSAQFGNVTLNEPTTGAADTLDFSNFQAGGVNLNLGSTAAQQVNSALTLTLPTGTTLNAIGTPGNDTITGGSGNEIIQSAAIDNADPYALPAVPPSSSIGSDTVTPTNSDFPAANPNTIQWVYLDFTDFTTPVEAVGTGGDSAPLSGAQTPTPETLHRNTINGVSDGYADGAYTAADQAAILSNLENIYAPFGNLVQFTTSQAVAQAEAPNNYETVYFNVTPVVNGSPSPGGESNEIDFRNLNDNTSMVVDVNAFLANPMDSSTIGLVPDTDSDWINLSTTVTAHELGHTLGLRHEDSFGPVGFGISNPPGGNSYFPTFADLTNAGLTAPLIGAFTTDFNVIASPASVGSTLANAASGQVQFGERDAVKLAFITNGTVVDGTAGTAAGGYTVAAAADQSESITLQREIGPSGNNPPPGSTTTTTMGTTTINAQPVSLYQLNVPNPITTGFDASKTFDVDAVDVLGTLSGSQPDFYTFQGQMGDLMNFEVMSAGLTRIAKPFDSVIYVYDPSGNLVTWNDDQFEPSDSSIVDFTLPTSGTYTVEVDSFSDAINPGHGTGGDYELFMYRFDAYNANGGNDVLNGGTSSTGSTTFIVGPGNDTITGGKGGNTVQEVGSANYTVSGTQITGLGTKTLGGIQNVSLIDTSYTTGHTITVNSSFTGDFTLSSFTGNDSLSAPSTLGANSVMVKGDLAAANVAGNVAGPFTVTGILGSFTVGGSNGINFNLSAAKVTGSITASIGAISGTIQTTGVRTDMNGVHNAVVGDIGTLTTNSSGQASVSTAVSSNGTFTGKVISAGSIYSTIGTVNGGFTGVISAAKDIGAAQYSNGNYAWNASGQVITVGGITTISGSDSGIISSGGTNYSNPTINGTLTGSVIAGGSILGRWTINNAFSGLISAGGDLGAASSSTATS